MFTIHLVVMDGFISVVWTIFWTCWQSRMACQKMYCSILSRAPLWTRTMADRFRHVLYKMAFITHSSYIFPQSNRFAPHCFSVLCILFFQRLKESHRTSVWFVDYIASFICSEKKVHNLSVQHFCALQLTFIRLQFQFSTFFESSGCGLLHE